MWTAVVMNALTGLQAKPPSLVSCVKVRQQQVTSKEVDELVITDSFFQIRCQLSWVISHRSCRRYTDPPCWSYPGSSWSLAIPCGLFLVPCSVYRSRYFPVPLITYNVQCLPVILTTVWRHTNNFVYYDQLWFQKIFIYCIKINK